MKRKSNQGFTIIELLLAFTLVVIVVVYLFNVILSIKNLYVDSGVRTQMLINQTGISTEVGNDLSDHFVEAVNTCGPSCIRFDYGDGSTADLIWDVENRTISFANHKIQYIKGAVIGAPTVKKEKVSNVIENASNSILSIHIPVTHKLLDDDFGIRINYPFDDRETNIPDIGPENFISVKLSGSLGSGVPTTGEVTLTAKPRPAENEVLGGYSYTWQKNESGTWVTVATTTTSTYKVTEVGNFGYRVVIKTREENVGTSNIHTVIIN